MILACQSIHHSFGADTILKDASFHIEEREKAAIVGINGAGKSTLLKIIVHELSPDSGQVVLAKGRTLGYLAQHQDLESSRTIYQELLEVKRDVIELESRIRALEQEMKELSGNSLSIALETYTRLNHEFEQKNGYAYQSEVTGVLKGLGFPEEEFDKEVNTLSGGQKTRVSLGKLLLSRPDIILLDEPTNHLDMASIAWLETFLLNYDGAVIIVAHDRYFLNRVVTKVIEIDNGQVTAFQGNYSDYAAKKAQLREAQMTAWLNQQKEIKHQEEVIAKLKSFNREKSIRRAESREKMLDKMDVLEKPTEVRSDMHIHLEPQIVSGNDVLTVEGLSKSFGSLSLFQDLNFEIKRGERVALIGNNGTGKTTILKILNGLLDADEGSFCLGTKVKIGYYDQEHHVLHMEKTLFEEISDAYPSLDNTKIRSTLAAFLFTGDDVFKRIGDLSGGERGRVSLAKLMLSEANFLILDEPTNHLDIVSKEILEEALNRYTGTVLYVSHDRYFINTTATRILDLTERQLVNYIGSYDYYLEKREELSPALSPDTREPVKEAAPAGKLDWKQQKEKQAQIRKRENDLKRTEQEIFALESRTKEIDTLLTREEIYTNTTECLKLHQEKESLTTRLETLYTQWETLA
ncbi:MAG: ABC-F type ribosomal protection protein [Lachnospiraceae bacterium]|jgi:ATP-binding cassette subfamily F protein 3|uniref:ABC-F family ATP-binding cassette domain-containing protein n=1 Tax=Candidatus Merdisoma sp. JLR.KK011 TaxID=3114299 RepID=UPI0014353AAB|nr:ABC-F type ribosomal protection protein [Lachnospiraceae bacterium]MCI9383113.1 ABC-F type ribosomal protection protein [Lachnospiraceae bacterium]MCI9479403.1 ABC-F type ribosomal protection protein [Lachnospiraceae bacterium]GFI09750.1 putative ABC transporter ATP-binding protein YbiT [Lachnospiraceae bacterium]